jgi:diaminohydroxyphosphoribosylaminopyrimidine deaminase/5-amino-6-(5-phosphoribosylamino)uracil reductase
MRRALALARRAEGRTSPNPIVGCVIVDRRGRVVAEGYHRKAGTAHAEVDALGQLGGRARGATMYVTLEPCAHRGGARRTVPCAPQVASSGIARLVYGLADPFPGHGGGAAEIARAGIRVDGPLLADECARANAPWITYATQGRAHVTLKAAMTLDGKIATRAGHARWITGAEARAEVHRLRARVDAIVVGSGTVLADDPLLTARGVPAARDPARVILDGRLRTPARARLLHGGSPAPTLIVTTRDAPARRALALEAVGAEVLRLTGRGGKVNLKLLLVELARREMVSVLVEGGAETHAAFLEAGLCDRLLLHVAPLAVGGARAPSWLGGAGIERLERAHRFRFDAPPRRVGDDLVLELSPGAGGARAAAARSG